MAKVNFSANAQDFQAAVLGSLGYSTAYIMARTNLSASQVVYRLGKAKVRRADYRNGTSQIAVKLQKELLTRAGEIVKVTLQVSDPKTIKFRKRA